MRTLAHLSDLHFGRTDCALVEGLHAALDLLHPDLIVISGDFTQRAKENEFQEARAFLDRLRSPWMGVPGNHDIRLYDLYGRFVRPLDGYRRYISPSTEPVYADPELAIVTVNTARSLAFKGGRLNTEQVDRLCRELAAAPEHAVKVLVAHHPLDLPEGMDHALAGRSRMALNRLATAGLDLILSGHLHLSYLPTPAEKLRVGGHSALLVQAGTAVSTRGRGEVNSFNVIVTEPGRIQVARHCWSAQAGRFEAASGAEYHAAGGGWHRIGRPG